MPDKAKFSFAANTTSSMPRNIPALLKKAFCPYFCQHQLAQTSKQHSDFNNDVIGNRFFYFFIRPSLQNKLFHLGSMQFVPITSSY
jgi:hypothetical protein